jgi:hypothetical protein
MGELLRLDAIRERIVVLRGQRVMLSGDLAQLYGVEPKALVQAVKRNASRFPKDFAFKVTPAEWARLRSQFVTLNAGGRGQHAKYPPLAFTEHGVTMLSSVLKSRRAVEVNIQIVRAFVHLRQWVIGNRELARKIAEMEKNYDGKFSVVFEALEQLMAPPIAPRRRLIGFGR